MSGRALKCLVLLACAASTPAALAQAESAADMARAWIAERGWTEGLNPDGSLVSVGTAPLDRTAKDPALARSWAFDLACLDAKNDLAAFLASEVTSTIHRRNREGDPLWKRVADRVDRPRETVMLKTFEQATWVVARATLAGVVARAQFSSDTMLAVVLRCDEVSIRAVEAAIRSEPLPPAAALESVEDLRTAAPESLRTRMGVQVMRDARGDACLVAFGQSGVAEEPLARDRAADRALMRARASLVRFFAEIAEGRSTLQSTSSLETLADGRSHFEATERLLRELSAAATADLREPERFRIWETSDGPTSTVGAIAVLRTVMEPLEPETTAGPGSTASVRADGEDIRATAVGIGRYEPMEDEGNLHPLIRRVRAVRAAVIRAKAEIARQLRQTLSTTLRARSVEGQGRSATSETTTQVMRQALAGAHIDRVEDLAGGDRPEVRVHVSIRASTRLSAAGGLLTFPTAERAADRLAQLAMQGLCSEGPVLVLIGTASDLRPVTFGVGLGAGADGYKLARIQAQTTLQEAAWSSVEGGSRLRSTAEFPDALSHEGCSAALLEETMSEWTRQLLGVVKPKGTPALLIDGELAACVMWDASESTRRNSDP